MVLMTLERVATVSSPIVHGCNAFEQVCLYLNLTLNKSPVTIKNSAESWHRLRIPGDPLNCQV